jgi:hypothetical protein
MMVMPFSSRGALLWYTIGGHQSLYKASAEKGGEG